jgi:hypothetical protein
LWGGGIADFGVSGLFAACTGAGLALGEEESGLDFCAVATPIHTAQVTNQNTALYFIIRKSPAGHAFPGSSSN